MPTDPIQSMNVLFPILAATFTLQSLLWVYQMQFDELQKWLCSGHVT